MLLRDWVPRDMMLDWESERLVSKERYGVLQGKRERDMEREGGRNRETNRSGYVRRYGNYEWAMDDPRPRLRRKRRFERF